MIFPSVKQAPWYRPRRFAVRSAPAPSRSALGPVIKNPVAAVAATGINTRSNIQCACWQYMQYDENNSRVTLNLLPG